MKKKSDSNLKRKYSKENEVTLKEYLDASMELEETQKAAGIVEEEKGLKKFITWIFDKSENRPKHKVKKMLYIVLALLFGWCGVHRFYEKRYKLGVIYCIPVILSIFNKNLFGLIGFPMAMSVIDIMAAIGHYSDSDGCIEI